MSPLHWVLAVVAVAFARPLATIAWYVFSALVVKWHGLPALDKLKHFRPPTLGEKFPDLPPFGRGRSAVDDVRALPADRDDQASLPEEP